MSIRKSPLALACLLMLSGDPALAADFRTHAWGDNETAIRAGESAQFLTEAEPVKGLKLLVYSENLVGLTTFLILILAQDQLAHAKYLFVERHDDGNLYLLDFANVEQILRQEYGAPVEAGLIWRNGAWEEGSDLSVAIALGELVLLARWETESTHFVHVILGDNLQIAHELDYLSKELGALEKELIQTAERTKY